MPDRDQALAEKLARLRRLIEDPGNRSQPRLNLARDMSRADRPVGGAGHLPDLPDRPGEDSLPVEALVPGTQETTPHGPFFLSPAGFEAGYLHGRWPLGQALQVTTDDIRWLSFPSVVDGGDVAGAVFVDVETTGLSGGTGTIPFLIGIGGFEGETFWVRQYLMRDPEEERAVLSAVAERVSAVEMVVSFNGKTFDLPLLETRFVLSRMRPPFPGAHLDLLFPARRVWGMRLASCSLSALEQSVLGVRRRGDVPGALVPQLYREYLRTGDGRCLSPIFDHNLADVLSLVSLLGRLGRLHRDPLRALEDAPEDLVAVGRYFERAAQRPPPASAQKGRTPGGGTEAGLACYQEALAAGVRGTVAEIARLRLAMLQKRAGRRGDAVRNWEQLATTAGSAQIRRLALVELAKHHEHCTRDLTRAAEYTAAAYALTSSASQRAAVARRRDRLQRKLEQMEQAGRREPPGRAGLAHRKHQHP